MKEEFRFNPLGNFNYSLLDDPEFGEDSVREEIIFPILKALGYRSDGNNKIVRSRKLLHPFVSIGSIKKKIYIIPDYTLEINGNPQWILEAKAPNQGILKNEHVEQAYSYAMHSEIKAKYFALCNGKEFVLYHVSEDEPIFHFNIQLLPTFWDKLISLLSPETLLVNDHRKLSKDFGLHIKRLGIKPSNSLIFIDSPIVFIGKISNNLYTFGSGVTSEGNSYCISFDFDDEILKKLKNKIPEEAFELLKKPIIDNSPLRVEFVNKLYYVNIKCIIGEELEESEDEMFLPLKVIDVLD